MINNVLYTLDDLVLLDQDEILSVGTSAALAREQESEKEKEFVTEEEGRKQRNLRSRKVTKNVKEK